MARIQYLSSTWTALFLIVVSMLLVDTDAFAFHPSHTSSLPSLVPKLAPSPRQHQPTVASCNRGLTTSFQQSSSPSSSLLNFNTRLSMALDSSSETNSPKIPRIAYGVAWVGLIAFTSFLAPGSFSSEADTAMIQAILENPAAPVGVNALFYFTFNLFVIIPITLAGLIYPQQQQQQQQQQAPSSNKGIPATPFLLLSVFIGYFGLGPYMIFRETILPNESVTMSSLNWVTRNVLENKIFNFAVMALSFYLLWASGVLVWQGDTGTIAFPSNSMWEEYTHLLSTSKLASVSTLDLTMLSVTAATLIPRDYQLRSSSRIDTKETSILPIVAATSTLLLPVVGSAVYCALRPKLPE